MKKIKELILKCGRQSDSDGSSRYKYTLYFIINDGYEVTSDFGGQVGISIDGISLSFNPHKKLLILLELNYSSFSLLQLQILLRR